MSPERGNETIQDGEDFGYSPTNVTLVCMAFNSARQMSTVGDGAGSDGASDDSEDDEFD